MRGAGRAARSSGVCAAGGFGGGGAVLLRAAGRSAGGGSAGDGTGGGLRFVGRTPSSAAGPPAGFSRMTSGLILLANSGSRGIKRSEEHTSELQSLRHL